MTRLLITGVSGLLGSNLAMSLKDDFEVLGTYHTNPVRWPGVNVQSVNVCSESDVTGAISGFMPACVIHSAAETRVDYCEENPEHAFRVNAESSGLIGAAASRVGARVVYISTDSVFDGRTGGYRETDAEGPVNVYARSKLGGETDIRRSCKDHLFLRTNIYGWNALKKLSLAEWVLRESEEGRTIAGFTDVVFAPVLVNDLSLILRDLLRVNASGTLHVGARDANSKYAFARDICSVFERDPGCVKSACSDDVGLRARRPKNTSLDVTKITELLRKPMPSIREGLVRFRQLWDDGFVESLRMGLA